MSAQRKRTRIRGVQTFVAFDEVPNDVHADIAVERAGDIFHPVEITAGRVEERSDAETREHGREFAPDCIRRGSPRAAA
jgi:hypothetical protein